MKQAPQSRTNPEIPESLNRRLNSYALAAGAAGVSLLAMAQPAQAKVVFTPAHIIVGFLGAIDLDINNDGITDFTLKFLGNGVNGETLFVSGEAGDFVQSMRTCSESDFYCTYAKVLNRGAIIGPGPAGLFVNIVSTVKKNGNYYSYGPWGNVRDHYMGLQLRIRGQAHFGWVRMSVRVQGVSITALITGYAYETIPDQPMRAGQKAGDLDTSASDSAPTNPGTLGALAQGSPGLQRWRRRSPAQSSNSDSATPQP